MKKKLLISSALLMAVTAFSQNETPKPQVSMENTAQKIALRLMAEARQTESKPSTNNQPVNNDVVAEENPVAGRTASFVSSWNSISSSINAYGVSVGTTRPLQYNEDLNAVTFIHRKSPSYVPSPAPTAASESGVVVGMITQNWGATWDSTCLWNDNTNWGRYPQGAIVSAPGSQDINNAKIVGCVAVNSQGTGWIGNGFYTKGLGSANYSNVAPVTSTFFPTLSANIDKSDFTIYDFQAMDDGKVVTLGYVNKDPNGTGATAFGYRGARVVKGSFVSGSMVWTSDSIIPSVASGGGSPYLVARPRMAWSEDGQVGYVVQIGVASSSTLNNRGYQPIVYKTSNGGTSWAPVSGIDFNAPTMSVVANMILSPNTNTSVTIPFFDYTEGMGLTVDKDNKLHIAALLRGTSSSDPDSLGYTYLFTHADGEKYGYRHTPGLRPFLFDFAGDGLPNSPWKVTIVDSLPSEGPGTNSTSDPNGYNTNPWSLDDGSKIGVESRIQCSRTPDGKYIVYTWAESDTAFTSVGANSINMKWNELPNIKARLMDVTAQTIHPMEINITKPGNNPFITSNVNVSSRAYLHYTSPKCALAQTIAVGASGPAIMMPITTSRPYNIPLIATNTTIHRYMSAVLNFGGLSQNDVLAPGLGVGINENALNSASNSVLFPNPANATTGLAINLKDNSKVEISVLNMIGQVVKTSTTDAGIGANTLNIDLNGLSQGIYMVNVKVANATSTKKLIVE